MEVSRGPIFPAIYKAVGLELKLTYEQHQLTKPYYKEYFAITEPMFLKPREAHILEPVGPGFTMIKAT